MKIIFSSDTLTRGGKERQLCFLFSQLPENKYDKLIFHKKKHINKNNNYLNEYEIPDDSVQVFENYNQYRDLIIKYKPDIVISWDGITSLYNLMLYRKFGYIFINGSVRHGIRLFKLSHFFRSIILWLSPHVIANSYSGLKANNLKPNNRNYVLYNGINTTGLKVKTTKEKRELRKELFPDLNSEKLFFISIANFLPYKDYFTVLNALSELKDKISFVYLIIGEGPLRGEIEEKINNAGLKENVCLLGRISNVKKYLDISDVYIHSSKGEGISNTILEAMLSGLPVVSSDVGGVRETVNEKTSFLYRYKDKEGLKDCIMKALNLVRTNFFKDENYVKHLEKFSTENMVKNFEDIINKIMRDENNRKDAKNAKGKAEFSYRR